MTSSEPETGTEAQAAGAPAPKRRAYQRAPKLDAVLAEAVERARQGVLEIAPAEQVGAYAGASAEGERLVVHRFEASVPGYGGWQWFASVARVPRSKYVTVCEVGLLPSEKSLLAPDWVPWAERVRPEEAAEAQEAAAAEARAAAGQDTEPGTAVVGGEDAAPAEGDEPAQDSTGMPAARPEEGVQERQDAAEEAPEATA
jgi:Protein of unknown function (DUF3027)